VDLSLNGCLAAATTRAAFHLCTSITSHYHKRRQETTNTGAKMRNYTLSYIHHIHYYQNMINDATDFVTRSIQTMNHELTVPTELKGAEEM